MTIGYSSCLKSLDDWPLALARFNDRDNKRTMPNTKIDVTATSDVSVIIVLNIGTTIF